MRSDEDVDMRDPSGDMLLDVGSPTWWRASLLYRGPGGNLFSFQLRVSAEDVMMAAVTAVGKCGGYVHSTRCVRCQIEAES